MNALALGFHSGLSWRATRTSRVARVTAPVATPAARSASDLALLIQTIAASGDRSAFTALYEHFAPRVRSYLTRLGAAPNVAEELTQETMLAVWRKAAYFDPERAGASTWIFTIARNLRIDSQRRSKTPLELLPDPSEAPEAPPALDSVMISAERDERIRDAMSQLSKEQAEIVKLCYFQDKPHSEIARVLDLPLGTVKSRVRLALGRLRGLLDDLK
jgi:RNA polymerase sigma-70 factor (ECF subfamily)